MPEGLYTKYDVYPKNGQSLAGNYSIVLEVGHPNSWPALLVWADTVEEAGHTQLAKDVRDLVQKMKEIK